jgi:hypothetical protein
MEAPTDPRDPGRTRSPLSLILAVLAGCFALAVAGAVAVVLLARREAGKLRQHIEARIHAEGTPGVPVADPLLPAGTVEIRVVPALSGLSLDKPVTLRAGVVSSTVVLPGTARLDGLAAGRHVLAVDDEHVIDPTAFELAGGQSGVQLGVRAIQIDSAVAIDDTGVPMTPEKVLEVDLTRAEQVVLRWKQGATVVALEELPRSAEVLAVPALGARFEAQWKQQRGHFDAEDKKLDQAVVRVVTPASFAEVFAVCSALLGPKRVMGSETVSAFHVSVQPPPPPRPRREPPPAGPAWKGPPPRVKMVNLAISGRLQREQIEAVLAGIEGDVRRCYVDGLRRAPRLEGRMAIRFVIGADGAVSHAKDSGSDLPDHAVGACVAGAIEELTFPRPLGGIVPVTAAYMLSPR